jgi:DNA polymerase III subunit epsilon
VEREIILDTETTGLDPIIGHRIIEIGCVELINRMPTGKTFHSYINPEREVPQEAFAIHGISTEFLKDKPKFNEIVDDFLSFIGDSRLVIHNAEFDIKFLNHHLFNAKKSDISREKVFCTLIFARKKFPGQQNSLDALCRRFGVDNSHRDKHGALLDSEILAEVYLELMGGKQNIINLEQKAKEKKEEVETVTQNVVKLEARKFEVSQQELDKHKEFVKTLPNSLWASTSEN